MFGYLDPYPDPDSLEMLDPDIDAQHWFLRYIRDTLGLKNVKYKYRLGKLPATWPYTLLSF